MAKQQWQVKITEEAAQVFESNELSREDKIVIENWAKTVRKYGPQELLKEPGVWADHPLYGDWRGHRASSFSYKGRIIYRIKDNIVTVVVMKITTSHNYRR